MYFLVDFFQIVDLLERMNASALIVRVCLEALNARSNEEPESAQSALLASTLFRHALATDALELACNTLRSLPDTPQRLHSLRLLVIRLCESSRFDALADLRALAGPLAHQVFLSF